jgi:anti-sigma regulatory factor (Ser/Thr protein kinase)
MTNIADISDNNGEKPIKITITLPTHAYFMSGIRDFTLSFIRNTTDFSEQWAFRFQSVVDELCNNAIEHGSKPGEEIKLTFVSYAEEKIEIIVEDTGTGDAALKAVEMEKIINQRTAPGFEFNDIRGRGLAKIVKEWTDEINFSDRPEGGLKIKVTKFLIDKKVKQLQQDISLAGDVTHLVV